MLTPRFDEALDYAVVVHAGQVRKGTDIPYVSHLMMVAAIAFEYGANEDEAIAALLHDAVEDGGGRRRLNDIRVRFGPAVADIVEGCSDTDVEPKPAWAERKQKYLEHLHTCQNPSVLFVSACDKLANARSLLKDYRAIGEQLWSRFRVGRDETLGYYQKLVDVLTARGESPVVEELARVVSELIALAAAQPPGGDGTARGTLSRQV